MSTQKVKWIIKTTMNYNHFLKLSFFTKWITNLFNKNKLIVAFTNNSIRINVLTKKTVIDYIAVEYDDPEKLQKCYEFLDKYPKFKIAFILANKGCSLRHESIPIIGSVLRSNPIEKFIAENYSSSQIVAYDIHKITTEPNEIWECVIASTHFCTNIHNILEYAIKSSFKIKGAYFLSLEFSAIIDHMINATSNNKYSDYLLFFTTITKANGIRVVVKYKKSILNESFINYPSDKSDTYIAGLIEQHLSDKISSYQEYTKELDLQICAMFLTSKQLKSKLHTLQFGADKVIALSGDEISHRESDRHSTFQDRILVENYSNVTTVPAFNKFLKPIAQTNFFNDFILKPWIILIILVSIILIIQKVECRSINLESDQIKKEHSDLLEPYRIIATNHTSIINNIDLINLYIFEKKINIIYMNPYNHLDFLLSPKDNNINITNIYWKLLVRENMYSYERMLNLAVSTVITIDNTKEGTAHNMYEANNRINEYTQDLASHFNNYSITYEIQKQNITKLINKTLIPVKFTLKKNLVGE